MFMFQFCCYSIYHSCVPGANASLDITALFMFQLYSNPPLLLLFLLIYSGYFICISKSDCEVFQEFLFICFDNFLPLLLYCISSFFILVKYKCLPLNLGLKANHSAWGNTPLFRRLAILVFLFPERHIIGQILQTVKSNLFSHIDNILNKCKTYDV